MDVLFCSEVINVEIKKLFAVIIMLIATLSLTSCTRSPYDDGYDTGYSDGKHDGYQDGFDDGKEAGYWQYVTYLFLLRKA